MVKIKTIFQAEDILTPEFAAKLVDHTTHFDSRLFLECEDKRLMMDSLICILALDMRRGVELAVIAEGADEQSAAEDICKVLEGAK